MALASWCPNVVSSLSLLVPFMIPWSAMCLLLIVLTFYMAFPIKLNAKLSITPALISITFSKMAGHASSPLSRRTNIRYHGRYPPIRPAHLQLSPPSRCCFPFVELLLFPSICPARINALEGLVADVLSSLDKDRDRR